MVLEPGEGAPLQTGEQGTNHLPFTGAIHLLHLLKHPQKATNTPCAIKPWQVGVDGPLHIPIKLPARGYLPRHGLRWALL